MKRKITLVLIVGIIICGVIGIKASTQISSEQVIYNDKTLKLSLDELYRELTYGKEQLAASITNKGVETSSTSSLDEMSNNIDNIIINELIDIENIKVDGGNVFNYSQTIENGYENVYVIAFAGMLTTTSGYKQKMSLSFPNNAIVEEDSGWVLFKTDSSNSCAYYYRMVKLSQLNVGDIITYTNSSPRANSFNGFVVLPIK